MTTDFLCLPVVSEPAGYLVKLLKPYQNNWDLLLKG